jgi:hypothetical protein
LFLHAPVLDRAPICAGKKTKKTHPRRRFFCHAPVLDTEPKSRPKQKYLTLFHYPKRCLRRTQIEPSTNLRRNKHWTLFDYPKRRRRRTKNGLDSDWTQICLDSDWAGFGQREKKH